jgi:hypothetical protein
MPLDVTAGVDTWKLCWRLHHATDAGVAAEEQAVIPTRRGRRFLEPVDGYQVIWFPNPGLLAAEGHPAGKGQLGSPGSLPEAQARLTRALEAQLGADLPALQTFKFSEDGIAGVSRLDITVDFAWDGDRREGLALLAGLAAVKPPGQLARRSRFQPGGGPLETVDWLGASGIKARAYDKSVESLLAPRGQLIRLEDQRRWASGGRRDVEELTAAYVQRTWQQRFMPLWRATKGLKIVSRTKLARELKAAVNEDRCTPGQAIDVAGHLVMEAAGVHVGSRNTRWRHASKARELGLVLADGVLEEEEYDVGEMMEAAFDPAVWMGPGPQG